MSGHAPLPWVVQQPEVPSEVTMRWTSGGSELAEIVYDGPVVDFDGKLWYPGEVVGVMGRTTADLVVALLAGAKPGGVPPGPSGDRLKGCPPPHDPCRGVVLRCCACKAMRLLEEEHVCPESPAATPAAVIYWPGCCLLALENARASRASAPAVPAAPEQTS